MDVLGVPPFTETPNITWEEFRHPQWSHDPFCFPQVAKKLHLKTIHIFRAHSLTNQKVRYAGVVTKIVEFLPFFDVEHGVFHLANVGSI